MNFMVFTLLYWVKMSEPDTDHRSALPGVKVKTARIADQMGILTTALYDKLIGRGYLELTNGKRRLTEKGKQAGGELEPGKETSFLWPPDLSV
jgi:hypothetical protein